MTGSVDDVDTHLLVLEELHDTFVLLLLPKASRRCRGNCNTTLTLLLHPVRHGRALMHFADLVDHAGVKKDTLGQRGLACINVSGDTDVPRLFKGVCAVWTI